MSLEPLNRTNRSARGLSLRDAEYSGNTSGYEAYEYKCFVLKDEVEEVTAGGIVLTNDLRDREKWTVSTGILVSCGDLAFTDGRDAHGEPIPWARKPQLGDRVMIKEYAGQTFKGKDGKEYFVYRDTDLMGGQA